MEMCSVTDLVNILSLTAVSCHSINNMQELEMEVKEIGDWEALCRQLQLSKTILDSMQSASMNSEAKKTACLMACVPQYRQSLLGRCSESSSCLSFP